MVRTERKLEPQGHCIFPIIIVSNPVHINIYWNYILIYCIKCHTMIMKNRGCTNEQTYVCRIINDTTVEAADLKVLVEEKTEVCEDDPQLLPAVGVFKLA